jgi:N-methylhydantoinase A/oxoprolinase/acetone carboxylase beta subunit
MPSSTPTDKLRIAIAAAGHTAEAVVMDARDRLLGRTALDGTEALADTLASVIRRVIADSAVEPARVSHAMLVSGELTAALTERSLDRVAVIRVGSPLTHAVPPLAAWPHALRGTVSAGEVMVGGGAEYDGRAAAPLDEDRIAQFLDTVGDDADAVAITAIFSPIAPDHELAAAAVVQRELGHNVRLSLSHELGQLGLVERENAAVLNAALGGAARRVALALENALQVENIPAETFLARHDGALMALQFAQRLPVLMLASGPANAMLGAVHLTGVQDAVVVHTSKTGMTVGTVVHGLLREVASPTEMAGVRVGFARPELRTLPPDGDADALAEAVQWARADLATPPVLFVGRADAIDLSHLPGIGSVLRPADGEIAAAVGAAIGEVTGIAYRNAADRPDRREEALTAAQDAAIALAVHAGADPDRLHVVWIDETALTYDIEPVVRIGVKVAGPPV